MKKSNVVRVGSIVGVIALLLIVFFYVLPIYHFKNADAHMKAITEAIATRSVEKMHEELDSRNTMNLVSDAQVQDFIGFANATKNNQVKSKLWSSDNIIITVSHDSSEAELVLGQKGILSKWALVNIRYLTK